MSTDKRTMRHASLPAEFRPLFWSYRFGDLDLWDDRKTVILQLTNFGTLAHWRWLVAQYGLAEVRRVLAAVAATEIRPRTRELASLVFSAPTWNHAPRGTHR